MRELCKDCFKNVNGVCSGGLIFPDDDDVLVWEILNNGIYYGYTENFLGYDRRGWPYPVVCINDGILIIYFAERDYDFLGYEIRREGVSFSEGKELADELYMKYISIMYKDENGCDRVDKEKMLGLGFSIVESSKKKRATN